MDDNASSLRFRRLRHLHDQWCGLSNDVTQLGTTIRCVLAASHKAIPNIWSLRYPQNWGLGSSELWKYLVFCASESLHEEFGHWELSDRDDPFSLISFYYEFEHCDGLPDSLPVRFISFEDSDPSNTVQSRDLPEDDFGCWDYQIYSTVNRFDFRAIGLRFCELSRMSAVEFGRESEVRQWIGVLAKERIEFADIAFWSPHGDDKDIDMKSLPPELNHRIEYHRSVGVGPFAVATFENNVAYESAKVIESLVDKLKRPSDAPQLTDLEREVLDFVAAHRGNTEQQIADGIATAVGKGTLSAHVFPKLKKHYHLRNKRGYGYYIKLH